MTTGSPGDGWKAVGLFHLSVFSFGVSAFTTALGLVVLPVLVLAYTPEELKNTYLGILGLAGLGVAIVVQPLTGHVSDRFLLQWGRRTPYIATGSLLTCLLTATLGLASSYLALLLALMATYLCLNTALGPYQALIRDLAPQTRRGVFSSFKVLADGAGGVSAAALGAFLLGLEPVSPGGLWQWLTLGLLAATLAASGMWTTLGIRGREAEREGQAPAAGSPEGRAHPQFRWFLGSRFCSIAALAALQTYAFFFLRDAVGLADPLRGLGIMTVAVGVCLLLAVYPAGRASDRVGRKVVLVASGLAAAVGVLLLLLADTLLEVAAVACLLGAAAGAFLTANWALATDLVSSRRTAQQMGISNAVAMGGSALARIAGPGVDLVNRLQAGAGYSVLIVACAVFLVLGALLLMPVRADASPEGVSQT